MRDTAWTYYLAHSKGKQARLKITTTVVIHAGTERVKYPSKALIIAESVKAFLLRKVLTISLTGFINYTPFPSLLMGQRNDIYFTIPLPKSIWRYWCLSLTFAHQAPFDELSLPTEGFEEVSRNDDAVIASSSMVPSDTPAGMGPTKRNVHPGLP